MGAGLAVLAAVQALGAHGARLKWPNDLVVEGQKLAGILVEARGLDARQPHAVVGVGLNVTQRLFPPELEAERAVTSLARLGLACTLGEAEVALLATLAPHLTAACEQPADTAGAYAAALGLIGSRVRVRSGRGIREGRLAQLSSEGLELVTADDNVTRIALEHVLALEAL
jgi:BirA family biotin operon repressor/biotin-[acetyl-CoA-carboxylase] ligase